MKNIITLLLAVTFVLFGTVVSANESEVETFAAVVSISDNPNPYVVGQAYGTDVVGFSISDQNGGDKVYGSGDIEVNNNSWSHEISTDLPNGGYEITLYIDNKEYDSRGFAINTKGDLYLSITPDEVETGNSIEIRFNDVGADYYNITASCKEGINISGQSKPDLCRDTEKIYPTGKDTILVEGFYPYSDVDVTTHIRVGAIVDGEEVRNEMEAIKIDAAEPYVEDDDFDYMFEKYGDIKFKTPEEGSKEGVGIYEVGETIKLKWENIVETDWSINLYKHYSGISDNVLRNGFKNGTMGTRVFTNNLGVVDSGTERFKMKIPNIEPGYYYFSFSGKAAGDNSPAIRIVRGDDNNDIEIEEEHEDDHLPVPSNNDEQIRELIKLLLKLIAQLTEMQARG